MNERRKLIRRQADRALLQQVHEQRQLIESLRAEGVKQGLKRERRHAVRHECKVVIHLPIGSAAGYSNDWALDSVEVKGRLLDLSAGGASLLTKHPFETGQQLQLKIELPGKTRVESRATVRWVKAIPEKGACASGVEFHNLGRKEQKALQAFLQKLDALGPAS